jgi:putative tricarboxylic transport membrane protein
VLSIAYYAMTAGIPDSQLSDSIGPQGLPRAYAFVLAALSVILILRSVRSTVRLRSDPAIWRVAGMLGIGVVYVLAVERLGYFLSIAGLIVATTYYQGGALGRNVVIVAVVGAVICWLLFVRLMGVPQPPGWWPALL